MKNYSIAIAGNPNSGKTTLFNGLTGSSQRIGNWPGVTVEKKTGFLGGTKGSVKVVDLPGIYSLDASSEDERVARDHILEEQPDLIVNILDASNLERNLYLTCSFIEMQRPLLVVLTMMDLVEKKRMSLNIKSLSVQLGVPVVGINGNNADHITQVSQAVIQALESPRASSLKIPYSPAITQVLQDWAPRLEEAGKALNPRLAGLKILDEDEDITQTFLQAGVLTAEEVEKTIEETTKALGDPLDTVIAEAKYAQITRVAAKVIRRKNPQVTLTEKIDRIVLNKYLGIPCFLGIMYLLFWSVTYVGGAFIDFFDIIFGLIFVDGLGILLGLISTPEWLINLLAGGVGAGIQTVATFIPIIFMMFFMMSILESSGYMARAAFVMDKFMRMLGLPGKAFVPMLVGFGCTVPAIMATRTLENKRDRYLTVFMTPFMSCGARLPVYALFGAAFFGPRSGLVIFSLYTTGIALGILTGLFLKNTLFRGQVVPFVMELPPYHALVLKNLLRRTWTRLKYFVIRAGKVIVLAVLVLSFLNSLGSDGSFGNADSTKSVLAQAGRLITPVFIPMGLEKENWPATVGLFTGIFAKEAIVGTVSGLYKQIDHSAAEKGSLFPGEDSSDRGFDFMGGLTEALQSILEGFSAIAQGFTDPLGINIVHEEEEMLAGTVGAEVSTFGSLQRYFNNDKIRAYAYLLFVLIYFPCLAALGAILREIGPRFGWLAMVYLTVLAWSMSTLFFQIFRGHNLWLAALAVGLVLIFIPVFHLVTRGEWFDGREPVRGKASRTPPREEPRGKKSCH